jgi:hypothetical protein
MRASGVAFTPLTAKAKRVVMVRGIQTTEEDTGNTEVLARNPKISQEKLRVLRVISINATH